MFFSSNLNQTHVQPSLMFSQLLLLLCAEQQLEATETGDKDSGETSCLMTPHLSVICSLLMDRKLYLMLK